MPALIAVVGGLFIYLVLKYFEYTTYGNWRGDVSCPLSFCSRRKQFL